MRFASKILRAVAVETLSRCLTGRPEDLRRLLLLEKTPFPSPVLRAFLRQLRRDLDGAVSGVFANILLHIGRNSNLAARRRLVENLIFNWGVRGAELRTKARSGGRWVPFIVVVSPTMRCNLKCTGCYAGLYARDGELNEQELDRLFSECRSIGNYFVVISGGEPYLLKDSLLRLFRKYDDMFFLTYTNGTKFDEPLVRELAAFGNVAPALSVEGFEAETDARRGPGVYARILESMRLLKKHGVMFGISVTYTSGNINVVTKDEFVDFYMKEGALFAWYFMFMPVGRDPVLELVPSPEQRVYCGKRVGELRKKYPLFLADFWNDGPAVAGCMAAARRYLHVLNSGRIEACVFAHFGVDNIRDTSLVDAANSPFFRAIRERFPYNKTGNLKRPCIILDNPHVLREVVDEFVPPQGHEHCEDLIRDPRIMQWVDNYAARLEELTEPAWLEMIENPASRWYRENKEYKNLFTFGKMGWHEEKKQALRQ